MELTKQEKIDLVKKAHEEVLKELGPMAPNTTNKFIIYSIQDKLPKKPIYDTSTIAMILNGHYE